MALINVPRTIEPVNRPEETALSGSRADSGGSKNLNSRKNLLDRLKRGPEARARFVDSTISKTVAFQTRALREKKGWSQQRLADKIGSNQNAIYRAENPNYGKHTVTTLKKIAAAHDVALLIRFVPYSEFVDWVSGTPRTIDGLGNETYDVPSFEEEEKSGTLEQSNMFALADAVYFDLSSVSVPLIVPFLPYQDETVGLSIVSSESIDAFDGWVFHSKTCATCYKQWK